MNRRNFIISAIGAAAMAVVPAKKAATLLHDAAHHDISGGFGLATIKQEGTAVLYDPGERMARALARSMIQTKEIVARNVLGRVFDDEEDGYTYRTFKTAKRLA